MANALVVDKRGLGRKLGARPVAFVVYELVQNAWDEPGVSEVAVEARMLPGRPVCRVEVRDDAPEGFAELSSVYTLFKDSKKGKDATRRGRFELGEKLVAAIALRLEVTTTKGCVLIVGDRRSSPRRRTETGSVVVADIRMTRSQYRELCAGAGRLLPPRGITTTFNGKRLSARPPLCSLEARLQTVRADSHGSLRTVLRKTVVDVHEPLPGEPASIYEMGIPVVATGDSWHYDVQQRVPVDWERSNVPPAYLRALRAEVVNAMAQRLSASEAASPWVAQAIEDERAAPETVKAVMDVRFGQDAVAYDPSDVEGTKMSFAEGRQVVAGGTFSARAWESIRKSGALPPAGRITPSPKPYGDGPPESVVDRARWTQDMRRMAAYAEGLSARLTGRRCTVYIVSEPKLPWVANYQRTGLGNGGPRLCLNLGRLGRRWFAEPKRSAAVLELLLHELAHEAVSDHLSAAYHRQVARLGAKLAELCLDEPELFKGGGQ